MRLGLRISVILISCCTLMNLGCTPERGSDGQSRSDKAKEAGQDEKPVTVVDPVVVADPVVPIVVPNNPFTPPPPPTGGGGGSQGAIKPARTGNPDASGRGGPSCGNGIQEARGQNGTCPYPIYGTQVGDGSSLLGFRLDGEQAFSQTITSADANCTSFGRITSLDFSPDGVLYAYGRATCGDFADNYLFILDCQTAQATLVGRLSALETSNAVQAPLDIDFDSHGKLYAYSVGVNQNELGSLNILNGQLTLIGGTSPVNEQPAGLASLNFPDPDFLFQAGLTLDRLDVNDGNPTPYGSILPAGVQVISMDQDPRTKTIYVSYRQGMQVFLGTLDRDTNTVTPVGAGLPAPLGFYGVTVNRTYEVCDGTAFELPRGTACNSDCELVETLCDDYVFTPGEIPGIDEIDNNYNGLANCDDPNCVNRECEDFNGCTQNEYCSDPRLLNILVSCTVDSDCGPSGSCNQNPDGNFCACSTNFNCPAGDFCQDDACYERAEVRCDDDEDCREVAKNATCQAGLCIARRSRCEGDSLVNIPVADGGCLDGNECTTDTCESILIPPFTDHSCNYSLNTDLTTFGSCTPEGNCSLPLNPDGSCPAGGQVDLCLVGACVAPLTPATCLTSEDCDVGSCVNGTCTCEVNSDCFPAEICDSGICNIASTPTCSEADLGVVPAEQDGCDDGNPCTTDGCVVADVNGILSPICDNGAIDNELVLCPAEDNSCQAGRCIEGNCDFSDPLVAPNSCFQNDECGGLNVCVGATLGVCSLGLLTSCVLDIECSVLGLGACLIPLGGLIPGSCQCDDGNPCTTGETCDDGACVGGTTIPDGGSCGETDVSCQTCQDGACLPSTDPNVCGPETLCNQPLCTETGCIVDVVVGDVSCVTPPPVGPSPVCFPGIAVCTGVIGEVGVCVAIEGAGPVPCITQ